jgi:hypothetical protein
VPTSRHIRTLAILTGPLVLAVTLAGIMLNNINSNDGQLVFSLDDPYIHLTMARNIVQNQTWGINPGEFVSTSSSPLFTITLAGLMTLFGPMEALAWALAIAGGLLATILISWRADMSGLGSGWIIVTGLYTVFVIGLAELSVCGMEHTLHMCAVLAIAAAAERTLSRNSKNWRESWPLLLFVLIGAGLRYETLFLLPPLVLILWFSRHRALAVAVSIVGLIPAVALGIFQMAHGSTFLPNTILVKAFDPQQSGLIGYVYRFLQQISSSRWIVIVIGAGAAVWIGVRRLDEKFVARIVVPAMVAFAVLAHMTFSIDYPRYVGYLIALGAWGLIPWVRDWTQYVWKEVSGFPRRALTAALIVMALLLPYGDQIKNWSNLPILGRDIYLQQIQMARFVSTYYPGRAVALNDIGAVAWAGNCRVLDLWGLASDSVAHWRSTKTYNSKHMKDIAAHYQAPIAIIYPSWFVRYGKVPEDWGLAGYWQINHFLKTNVGGPVIFFFATNEAEEQPLLRNLQQFEPSLPPDAQAGY